MEYNQSRLGNDMEEVKESLKTLKGRPVFRHTNREGLYFMVALGLWAGVKSCSRTGELLERTSPIIVENVIGNPEPEKFYMRDEKRCFVEIDGKPVELYVSGK